MKAQNIAEFKALIERYETITINEISDSSAHYLTGFGNIKDCSLCRAVGYTYLDNPKCNLCVYGENKTSHIPSCAYGELQASYDLIDEAETPEELLYAYRNRAKVLREYAKNKNIKL